MSENVRYLQKFISVINLMLQDMPEFFGWCELSPSITSIGSISPLQSTNQRADNNSAAILPPTLDVRRFNFQVVR